MACVYHFNESDSHISVEIACPGVARGDIPELGAHPRQETPAAVPGSGRFRGVSRDGQSPPVRGWFGLAPLPTYLKCIVFPSLPKPDRSVVSIFQPDSVLPRSGTCESFFHPTPSRPEEISHPRDREWGPEILTANSQRRGAPVLTALRVTLCRPSRWPAGRGVGRGAEMAAPTARSHA